MSVLKKRTESGVELEELVVKRLRRLGDRVDLGEALWYEPLLLRAERTVIFRSHDGFLLPLPMCLRLAFHRRCGFSASMTGPLGYRSMFHSDLGLHFNPGHLAIPQGTRVGAPVTHAATSIAMEFRIKRLIGN